MLNASFALWLLASLFVGGKIIQAFKERVTYPRTGYVKYQKEQGSSRRPKMLLVGITSALASGLLILLILKQPEALNLMPVATGMILAVMLVVIGWRSGLLYYYILGGLALLLGLGLAASIPDKDLGLALLYDLLGLALLGMGGVILWRYLRRNPGPLEDGNGHED